MDLHTSNPAHTQWSVQQHAVSLFKTWLYIIQTATIVCKWHYIQADTAVVTSTNICTHVSTQLPVITRTQRRSRTW